MVPSVTYLVRCTALSSFLLERQRADESDDGALLGNLVATCPRGMIWPETLDSRTASR